MMENVDTVLTCCSKSTICWLRHPLASTTSQFPFAMQNLETRPAVVKVDTLSVHHVHSLKNELLLVQHSVQYSTYTSIHVHMVTAGHWIFIIHAYHILYKVS